MSSTPPAPPSSPRLTRRTIIRLAAAGDVDPRSVERVARGEPVRDRVRARIEEAARELGVDLPPANGAEVSR
jgi:DNA-binding LacI/PurR family transcriptional regulator